MTHQVAGSRCQLAYFSPRPHEHTMVIDYSVAFFLRFIIHLREEFSRMREVCWEPSCWSFSAGRKATAVDACTHHPPTSPNKRLIPVFKRAFCPFRRSYRCRCATWCTRSSWRGNAARTAWGTAPRVSPAFSVCLWVSGRVSGNRRQVAAWGELQARVSPGMQKQNKNPSSSDDWKSPSRLEERDDIKLNLASMKEQLTEENLNRLSARSFLLIQPDLKILVHRASF